MSRNSAHPTKELKRDWVKLHHSDEKVQCPIAKPTHTAATIGAIMD